jgi:hypothetical protein
LKLREDIRKIRQGISSIVKILPSISQSIWRSEKASIFVGINWKRPRKILSTHPKELMVIQISKSKDIASKQAEILAGLL